MVFQGPGELHIGGSPGVPDIAPDTTPHTEPGTGAGGKSHVRMEGRPGPWGVARAVMRLESSPCLMT